MKFLVNKNDFLTFQLYAASKSKSIKRRKIIGSIITTFSFIVLALVFIDYKDKILTYYFLGLAILNLFLYPIYIKWVYKRHYSKYIDEYYKNKIDIESDVCFNDEFLCVIDKSGEVKIRLSEIEEINEISDNLYIKITSGISLIFPKRNPDYTQFKVELEKIATNSNIIWNKELAWKWR